MGKSTSTVSRRNEIIDIINSVGQVFVVELSEKFEVSEVTIRNDLEQLEQKNILMRARGGAIRLEGRVGIDYNLSEKDKLNLNQKVKIGKKAAELVKESEIVLIDSGTTTAELAKNLTNFKELTVITNALNIAYLLGTQENIKLTIPGGFLRKSSQSLVGPLAEKGLQNFYVDKAFLGVDGLDPELGLYTPNIEEAHLNSLMIEIANEVILLCDSTKLRRKSFAHICSLNKINILITDENILESDRRKIEESGVKVIIA